MGFDSPDVYGQPEEFGLTLVGSIDWESRPYEFDMTIVLQDEQGSFYWASDSGCSCPSPFESFTSMEYLESGNIFELTEYLSNNLTGDRAFGEDEQLERATVDVVQLLMRIRLKEGF